MPPSILLLSICGAQLVRYGGPHSHGGKNKNVGSFRASVHFGSVSSARELLDLLVLGDAALPLGRSAPRAALDGCLHTSGPSL